MTCPLAITEKEKKLFLREMTYFFTLLIRVPFRASGNKQNMELYY